MPAKVPHLLRRDGRYYARIIVPVELREFVGKTELRAPIGGDRAAAIKAMHEPLARFQRILDDARRLLKADAPPSSAPARSPRPRQLPPQTIAAKHYTEQVAFDEELRNTDWRYAG